MKSYPLISDQDITRIKQDYEQAAAYQRSDPSACLLTSRRIAEAICKQLITWELAEGASNLMLYKLINKLSNDKIIPYYVEAPLRAIQSYGNLGAHPQGKDAEKITPEYVQPCVQGLAVVVDWYLHTYRPVKAIVFTERGIEWRRIEYARVHIRPDLKIACHEHPKDLDAAELVKMCQSYAEALQPIPCIFLFAQQTPQSILQAVSESGKPFKTWDNRVFSLILPEDADITDVGVFGELFTVIDAILHAESQTPVERQRRIDAAVPEASEVNQHVDLLVQIRFPHSPILGREQWPARHKPQAVESASGQMKVKFPVDTHTGAIQSTHLQVNVSAPDCIVRGEPEKRIEIPPDDYSQVIEFLLTPKKEGVCRIQVEVQNDERTYLGTVTVNMLVAAARNAADQRRAAMNAGSLLFFADKGNGHDTPQGSPQLPLDAHIFPPQAQPSVFVTDIERIMKLNSPFLADMHNQNTVSQVCEEILWSYDPEHAETTSPFIPPLVQKYARGQMTSAKSGDVPGGFGLPGATSANFAVKTIVPVVIFLLKILLCEEQPKLWTRLKRVVQRDSAPMSDFPAKVALLQTLTEDDIRQILRAMEASLAQEDLRKFTQIVKTVITHYLETR